jgi:hypothetical protein
VFEQLIELLTRAGVLLQLRVDRASLINLRDTLTGRSRELRSLSYLLKLGLFVVIVQTANTKGSPRPWDGSSARSSLIYSLVSSLVVRDGLILGVIERTNLRA